MEQVAVYNNDSVLGSTIDGKYITTIANVCVRDYGHDFGFSHEVSAIDLDSYETSQSGANDKTMDAAIGIADYKDNKASNPRLLLIELRLDYGRQGQNSKSSDMKKKETHSRNLLRGNDLDQRSFFVFDEKVAAARRNVHAREKLADSSIRKWEILTPSQFHELFCFVENLPYQPITNVDDVIDKVTHLIAVSDYSNIIQLVKYWINQEQTFFFQYKLNECNLLLQMISDILDVIRPIVPQFQTQDLELDYLICEEEYQKAKMQLEKKG